MLREPQTVQEAVEIIGGNDVVAGLTGRKTQHVSNWKADNRFPPKTFLVLSPELQKHGYKAPPRLWGMIEPERAAS